MSKPFRSRDRREPSDLAWRIARDIFETGREPRSEVHRITFMGGGYPDSEYQMGGLNLYALARRIDQSLEDHATTGSVP